MGNHYLCRSIIGVCRWLKLAYREVRFGETLLFSQDWPKNGEESHSASASIDELQTAISSAKLI